MIDQTQLPMTKMGTLNDLHLEEMLLLNRLEEASQAGVVEEVRTLLDALISHTEEHFDIEEDLMEEGLYPASASHVAEHERHLRELHSVRDYFQEHEDTRAVSAYIQGNLLAWFIHHTQSMDVPMSDYLSAGTASGCGAAKGCTTNSC